MRNVVAAFLALLMLLTMLTPVMAVNPGLPNVVVPNYPDGVVLHLSFDEGSGNVAYNSVDPTQLNGTLLDNNATNADGDTPPTWTAGIVGTALKFDGVDDYVEILDNPSLDITNELTIILYVKQDGHGYNSDYNALVTKRTGAGQSDSYGLWIFDQLSVNAGKILFSLNGTSDGKHTLVSQSTIKESGSIVAAVFNGTWMGIYIDGALDSYRSFSSFSIPTNDRPLNIGGQGPFQYNYRYFNGTIDEVYIFNRALSDEEIKLLYELIKPHKFSSQPTITPTSIPVIDINTNQTAVIQLQESTTEANAYLPIPVAAKNVNPARWVYTVDGDILQFDDNRYVNATSVTFQIPLQIYTNEISTIPTSMILDSDSKTYRYEAEVNVYNPSDIDLIGVIGIDPSDIGVATANMNGMFMAYNNGLLTNAAPISPGHNQFKITAELPLEMKEVEFRATIDDYLDIDTFDEAVKAAQAVTELKTDTMIKVITVETINFKDFSNRSVIIPLKGVKPSDVIEAKALTGSRPDIEVRKTDDGCELVIPPSAFTGEFLDYNKAEIKLIYLKKPAWWEKIPFLKSLGGFFEFLKKLFGGG